MPTFHHEFTRPDGSTVTVKYTFSEGSPTTYSPAFGADGGDPAECEIVNAFNDAGTVELPDDEREGYENWIIEHVEHEHDPPDCD